MLKSKFNTDYIFLGLLGVLLCNTIYQHVINDIVLNLNNYLALAAWVLCFVLVLTKIGLAKYAIATLLLLGLFEVFNFMPGSTKLAIDIGDISNPDMNGIGFSPVVFLFCVAYYIANKTIVHQFFSKRLHDSDDQRFEKQNKMIAFYYNKFSCCSTDEFAVILTNYNDYPEEAKIAIDRVKESKFS